MSDQTTKKSLLSIMQSAAFRDAAFAVILLVVELVLAARYGADTFRMALTEHQLEWGIVSILPYVLASLDVLLIDGVFVMMLVIAKYAGQSAKAAKIRPFTAIGAVIMFLVMLLVAVKAMPVIAAARWAGALLLAYVMSDILIDLLHRFQQWTKNRSENPKPFHERLFTANKMLSYVLILVLTAPLSWMVMGLYSVGRDYIKYMTLESPLPQMPTRNEADDPDHSNTAQQRTNGAESKQSGWNSSTDRARAAKRAKRDRRLALGKDILLQSPDLSGAEFFEALQKAYRSEFGSRAKVGKSTAFADLKLLRSGLEAPAIASNGNGVQAID